MTAVRQSQTFDLTSEVPISGHSLRQHVPTLLARRVISCGRRTEGQQ